MSKAKDMLSGNGQSGKRGGSGGAYNQPGNEGDY